MKSVKDLEEDLGKKYKKLKKDSHKKPFKGKYGFKKKKKQPKVSGEQGTKVVKELFGY